MDNPDTIRKNYIACFLTDVFPELQNPSMNRVRTALEERIWHRVWTTAGDSSNESAAAMCGEFVQELLKMRNSYLYGNEIEERARLGHEVDRRRIEQLDLQIEETKLRIARMNERR